MTRPVRTRQRVAIATAQLLADVQIVLAEQGITIVNRRGYLRFVRNDAIVGEVVVTVALLAVVEDLPVEARR